MSDSIVIRERVTERITISEGVMGPSGSSGNADPLIAAHEAEFPHALLLDTIDFTLIFDNALV